MDWRFGEGGGGVGREDQEHITPRGLQRGIHEHLKVWAELVFPSVEADLRRALLAPAIVLDVVVGKLAAHEALTLSSLAGKQREVVVAVLLRAFAPVTKAHSLRERLLRVVIGLEREARLVERKVRRRHLDHGPQVAYHRVEFLPHAHRNLAGVVLEPADHLVEALLHVEVAESDEAIKLCVGPGLAVGKSIQGSKSLLCAPLVETRESVRASARSE